MFFPTDEQYIIVTILVLLKIYGVSVLLVLFA